MTALDKATLVSFAFLLVIGGISLYLEANLDTFLAEVRPDSAAEAELVVTTQTENRDTSQLYPREQANTGGTTTTSVRVLGEQTSTQTASEVGPNSFDILVDKDHALPASYQPDDLTDIASLGISTSGEVLLRQEAAIALRDLFAAASRSGHSYKVVSGYRSYAQQLQVHASWRSTLGAEAATRTSAPAGHSEHQLGTTVDIVLPAAAAGDFSSIYPGGPTPAWRWLDQNAHNYGFVMSYRYGQEQQTGYQFEPWHWRYVGSRELAYKIRSSTAAPQSHYKVY